MRVHIIDVNPDTGEETYRTTCDITECYPEIAQTRDMAEASFELASRGRYWEGGGAGPLVLLLRADGDIHWIGQPDVQAMLTRPDDKLTVVERIEKARKWFKGFGTTGACHHVGRAAERSCAHNTMVATGDPAHAWKCADCGYVYGLDRSRS